MPKWVRSGVLDNGINDIKNGATTMLLISAYVAGDSYAVVVANKLNAGVAMVAADFTVAAAGSNRTLTTGAKSAAATVTSGAAPDLHIAFTDGTANVLWVTDETSNQTITLGNTINFPALVYTSSQPV